MASTAGPRHPRESRVRQQVRVKGFIGRSPRSDEGTLLRRLAGLGFERVEAAPRSSVGRKRFSHSKDWDTFIGKLGESQVQIRLRRGTHLEIRVTFAPRSSFRRASKWISRLGLRGLEGRWT
jgi:hypothetical protein